MALTVFTPLLHFLLYDCDCNYLSQYIDDSSIIYSNNIEEANSSHNKIKAILQDHGFTLNQEKQCPPSRKQKILGFLIDTNEMKMYCDPKKFETRIEIPAATVPLQNHKIPGRYSRRKHERRLGYSSEDSRRNTSRAYFRNQ